MSKLQQLFSLTTVVAGNLVMQFLFQWYIVVHFGAGTQSDVFFGSLALPQFILTVLSGSLTMVLIPILAPLNEVDFQKEVWKHLIAILLLFGCLLILCWFTTDIWVSLLLPGFRGVYLDLAISLSRIQLLSMLIAALLSVLWAAYSAREKILRIEITGLLASTLSFIAFYLSKDIWGIYAAAWSSVLRVAVQVLLLLPLLKLPKSLAFSVSDYRLTLNKVRPLVTGNIYMKTDTLLDRYITSKGLAGDLTLFNMAQMIFLAGNSILVKVLANTVLPILAKIHLAGDIKAFMKTYYRRFWLSAILALAMLASLLLFGSPALKSFLMFKNFNEATIEMLWWLLLLMGGLFVGGLLGSITAGAFYAQGNTRTPTYIGIVLFTIYAPLKILSFHWYGIKGLALSISAYYMISVVVQMIVLQRNFVNQEINHSQYIAGEPIDK